MAILGYNCDYEFFIGHYRLLLAMNGFDASFENLMAIMFFLANYVDSLSIHCSIKNICKIISNRQTFRFLREDHFQSFSIKYLLSTFRF